jgi:hypothetical protein
MRIVLKAGGPFTILTAFIGYDETVNQFFFVLLVAITSRSAQNFEAPK